MKKILLYITLLSFIGFSCEKEIDLKIPDQESQLVVECYLDPGKPYQLTLSETVSFTADPGVQEVVNALVIISYKGQNDTLLYTPFTDPKTNKFYNYTSTTTVPVYDSVDFNEDFQLYIKGPKGRIITGKTRFLPKVPIDTVKAIEKPPSQGISYLLASFQEVVGEKNFYRISFVLDSIGGEVVQEFYFNDDIFTDEYISIGTGYEFFKDDSAFVTLYHLSEADYDFLESAQLAFESNGNPFATPSKLVPTVQGGIGIFSALSYDRKSFKVDF